MSAAREQRRREILHHFPYFLGRKDEQYFIDNTVAGLYVNNRFSIRGWCEADTGDDSSVLFLHTA